jgi:hypothetical protein
VREQLETADFTVLVRSDEALRASLALAAAEMRALSDLLTEAYFTHSTNRVS